MGAQVGGLGGPARPCHLLEVDEGVELVLGLIRVLSLRVTGPKKQYSIYKMFISNAYLFLGCEVHHQDSVGYGEVREVLE